mgnify:CR=1 FL=1
MKQPIGKYKWYRISADGGKTWTEQLLTKAEAIAESEKYDHLCNLIERGDCKNG